MKIKWPHLLKQIFTPLLVAQLILAPVAFAAPPHDSHDDHRTPYDPEQLHFGDQIETAAKAIENGETLPIENPFRVLGQWVEVYDGAPAPLFRYDLNSPSLDRRDLAYTSIRARLDQNSKTLVIEAWRGENDNGDKGVLVARQYIPNINGKAIAQDKEILSIVDDRGNIHAIDWGYVATQAFKSPVPVYENIYQPAVPTDYSAAEVKATYRTSGLAPFEVSDLAENAVVFFNEQGEVQLTAGDLLVTVQQPGQPAQVVGEFSREVMHQRISEGSRILEIESALATKDSEYIKLLEQAIAEEDSRTKTFQDDLKKIEDRVSDPVVALTLQSFSEKSIATLGSRSLDHKAYSQKDRDWFTLDELRTRYQALRARAEKEYPNWSPEQLAKNWKMVANRPDGRDGDSDDTLATPKSFYVKFAAAVGLMTAYMASPALIENVESLQQISAIHWLYANGFPAVLKDASYRSVLIFHTLAMMSLWPAAVGISMISGKILAGLNKVTQFTPGSFGRKIRDLAKDWVPRSSWQRIITFGMRYVYSELVLGAWITAIERLGRQKTFFTALNNGLNPFRIVKPDSDVGQKLGLKKSEFLGLNNPFQTNGTLADTAARKLQIQSEMVAKKESLRQKAVLLAAVAVGEQYDIDLSTLLTLGDVESPKLSDVKALLENPKAREEWRMLSIELQNQVLSLSASELNGETDQVPADVMAEQYEKARQLAVKLHNLPDSSLYLKKLRQKSKKWAFSRVHDILNLGRDNFTFLKKTFVDKFVSTQVEREFGSDHAFVVYLVALYGQRADLENPELLAALDKPSHLWTGAQHWNDIGLNTYVHFFVAGARLALVYQTVQPEEETAYQPMEDVENPVPETYQGFFRSLKMFFKDTVNPMKSDVGGVMWQAFKRQLTTIQAFIIMGFLTRVGLSHQSLDQVGFALAYVWLAQTWMFAWPWYPLQAGVRYQGQKFKSVNDRIVAARRHIQWANRQSNPEEATRLRKEAVKDLLALYKELNPKALEGVDVDGDVEKLAEDLFNQTSVNPPLEAKPNTYLLWLAPLLAAVSTTAMAIPLSVNSFDPNYLNFTTLAEWTALNAAAYTALYWGFSKKGLSVYKGKVSAWLKKTKKSCEDLLIGRRSQ